MKVRSFGELVGSFKKSHRTGQKVHRNSRKAGTCERELWSSFNPKERAARMRAAELFDRKHKQPGQRNGPLGHVALEVLREMMRIVDFKTGRLEPSLKYLAKELNRSISTIHDALGRLRKHGWIAWERRYEPLEDPDPFGPQVRQVTNAYALTLPHDAAGKVRRLNESAPMPADEAIRREEEEERTATMLASLSSEDLARFRAGDSPLGDVLASLGRALDLNAIRPGRMNPALRG
jgi:hypothetical protein